MDLHRPTAPVPSPAEPLVRELVPVAGQLHAVLAHMEQFAAHAPPDACAPPIPDVLAGLLEGILTPLARGRGDEVAAAGALLREVGAAIERELYLVNPDRG